LTTLLTLITCKISEFGTMRIRTALLAVLAGCGIAASAHAQSTVRTAAGYPSREALDRLNLAVEWDMLEKHLLCANVGVQQFGSIDRLTEEDWSWVLGVNVLGTVRTVASFLPAMRRRTGWRHISLTASSGVFVPSVRLGAYTTSKYAVVGYAETLRAELADEGIGVTIVFPAGMSTRHLESSALARPEVLGASITMPDDIEAMLTARHLSPADDVMAPEDAIHGLLPDLLANEPYFMTHGKYRPDYEARLAA
jgi:NAD(P)-dependent dehydrogenase (short-subunit alcohol dehydrogenase family)